MLLYLFNLNFLKYNFYNLYFILMFNLGCIFYLNLLLSEWLKCRSPDVRKSKRPNYRKKRQKALYCGSGLSNLPFWWRINGFLPCGCRPNGLVGLPAHICFFFKFGFRQSLLNSAFRIQTYLFCLSQRMVSVYLHNTGQIKNAALVAI